MPMKFEAYDLRFNALLQKNSVLECLTSLAVWAEGPV